MKFKIRSFATRMCLYVITFTIVVFLAVMTILYTSGRTEITNNAVQHTHDLLQNMATQINGLLVNVEATMQNSVWMIEESLPNPDSMYRIASAIAKDNNNIIGCGIAFEP
ncbi:MAG: IcfG-like protein, partial [Rikenellaceae bacterium]